MKNLFLRKVYKLNKRLFVFFILFISGSLFTNLLGWQATPFFVWGMFSEKEDTSISHPVLKITINDSSGLNYTTYSDANKFFLISPLQLYIRIKKNNGEDPIESFLKRKFGTDYSSIQTPGNKVLNGTKEYRLFLPWYKKYLEQSTGIEIYSYKIELLEAVYSSSNNMEIRSCELIETWKQ